MVMTEKPMRRLSDKILLAFSQACQQQDLEVAEVLHRALELVMTRSAGKEDIEKRHDVQEVLEAYDNLRNLRSERA